jgi:hypothetical protein
MSSTSSFKATVTLPEVANIFGMPPSTIYDLAKRGLLPLPTIRFGRRIVVPRIATGQLLAGEASNWRVATADASDEGRSVADER